MNVRSENLSIEQIANIKGNCKYLNSKKDKCLLRGCNRDCIDILTLYIDYGVMDENMKFCPRYKILRIICKIICKI